MIRKFEEKDKEQVMKIWLNVNIQAHHFIEEGYWKGNFAAVSEVIPQSEVYVYEENEVVVGFIGLSDQYIAGIFVDNTCQSKGIGAQLLEYAKERKDGLMLHVYEKNVRAVSFYKREGFVVKFEQMDENTGEKEYEMYWEK